MQPNLTAQLTGPASVRADQPVTIEFSLTNAGEGDWYVLMWLTPLEGLLSACLRVFRDGRPLRFVGIMVKRGRPEPEDFVLVRACDKVSRAIDLRTAYAVCEPGDYTVELRTRTLECVAVSDPHRPHPTAQDLEAEHIEAPLASARLAFRVVGAAQACSAKYS